MGTNNDHSNESWETYYKFKRSYTNMSNVFSNSYGKMDWNLHLYNNDSSSNLNNKIIENLMKDDSKKTGIYNEILDLNMSNTYE